MGKFLKAGRELDRYLDLVLLGKSPSQIAAKLGWSVGKAKAFFRPAFYPDARPNRAPYEPTGPRIDRSGRKMTQLELNIMGHHAKAGVPPAHTAVILQRKPAEICPDYYGKITFHQMRCLAPVSDLILAHHYLYWVLKRPIIAKEPYDQAVADDLGAGGDFLKELARARKESGGPQAVHYPAHIRALAAYLQYKFMEVTGAWNEKIIPYGWTKERHWKRKTS